MSTTNLSPPNPLITSLASLLAAAIKLAATDTELVAAVRAMLAPEPPATLHTVQECAAMLRITSPTLRKLVAQAEADGVHVATGVGRKVSVDLAALRQYLATRPARKPASAPARRAPVADVDVTGPLRSLGLRAVGGAK
jgi:hypothetical protein